MAVCSVSARISRREGMDGQAAIYRLPLDVYKRQGYAATYRSICGFRCRTCSAPYWRRYRCRCCKATSSGCRPVSYTHLNTEGIDEELLLASIGRRTQDGTLRPAQEVPAAAPTEEDTAAPEPPPVQPVTREKAQRESGRRKRQDEDYNELFLRRNEIKTRQCVYISRDVHGKILRIVNDIAGGEISVGGYVDTVLRQHLEQHKERINELYKKQREDLI